MSRRSPEALRADAIRRAEDRSPFLRDALHARPDIADRFLAEGAEAAAALALAAHGDTLDARLRRQRHGLALAVALGDLAGELSLEQVTGLLSDFADRATDEALRSAIVERVTQNGFT